MNRTLRKAIMTRSKLKRRYILDRTTVNFEKYKKQRNICVNLLRKIKKQYFNSIDVKNITDNKKFWKTDKPKFSNKYKTANTIILVKYEKILHDEKAIANNFNNYFTEVTHSLGLKKKNIGLGNTLSKIVKTFRNFRTIKKIKESQQGAENSSFSFKIISEEEVKNVIKDLPINKSYYFLVIFLPKFLSSMLRSTPTNWQISLMNL